MTKLRIVLNSYENYRRTAEERGVTAVLNALDQMASFAGDYQVIGSYAIPLPQSKERMIDNVWELDLEENSNHSSYHREGRVHVDRDERIIELGMPMYPLRSMGIKKIISRPGESSATKVLLKALKKPFP